ncbi:MAG: class I SAM-dependent methyltransferase [Candidatus Omnitrophica bacterium]|nr:class I SAM-dependent methyltransferase [Candidatus Omnitrophota bacterium]MDD5436567.1 class I SAM-dependent methyltransferase [Candidatus Omnitrophota bacterium]
MIDKIVAPEIYSRDYFLSDNEGFREYFAGLDNNMHAKFRSALEYGRPAKGDTVLDIGCGRGELVYYCARKGAKALGIDYSKDAVDIARETIAKLPEDLRRLARAEIGDPVTYDFKDEYDVVFMIEIAEHMYDWQLEEAFRKIYKILKPGGRLVITTPNYYYEQYLSPLKRIMNIPFGLFKWPFRIFKDKYRKMGPAALLKKVFRIKADRGELNRKMHVNVTTPGKLKKLLSGFDTSIKCEDASGNIISLITRKWCGREIVVIAHKR